MFIAADIQKRALKRKQGQLQYSQIIASNKLNNITAQLNATQNYNKTLDKSKSSKDYSCTANTDALNDIKTEKGRAFAELQAKQTQYDLEKDSIESQLKLIDAQIDNMGKLVQNNINQDCTLWCVGGSS